MASLSPLWWMTPIQGIVALTAGFNGGASALQSLMIFPLLEQPSTPPQHTARLLRDLLHRSDSFFPRINAIGTLANLALTLLCVVKRHEHAGAAAKWPVLAAAWLCNVGTTVWSLGVQVPINARIREVGLRVGEGEGEDGKAVKELRALTARWKPRALVRAAMMLSASALGMYTLFLDGHYQ